MMSRKRGLQYATEGVWLGRNKAHPLLPPHIRALYQPWESSSSQKTWAIFNKYLPSFTAICAERSTKTTDFIFNISLNNKREKAKQFASKMIVKQVLLNENFTPPRPTIFMVMRTIMSRLKDAHRMPNTLFKICLQRKLRLPVIEACRPHKWCSCDKTMDIYGDHSLGCSVNFKTKASNGIR